jgi:hypothetical protein
MVRRHIDGGKSGRPDYRCFDTLDRIDNGQRQDVTDVAGRSGIRRIALVVVTMITVPMAIVAHGVAAEGRHDRRRDAVMTKLEQKPFAGCSRHKTRRHEGTQQGTGQEGRYKVTRASVQKLHESWIALSGMFGSQV